MIDTTVITCILGGHDNLREPIGPHPGFRFVCYSDEPWWRDAWDIQPASRPFPCPTRNSRIPKILSHLHCESPVSIWHDGCFVTKSEVVDMIPIWLKDADIALFRHPGRPDVYKEVVFCTREADAHGFDRALIDSIQEQVETYRSEGFPGTPFVSGGVIVRRENDVVRGFNEMWWREYLRWGRRDQFSLAYCLWKSGIRLHVIDGYSPLTCPWFDFNFHAAFADGAKNPDYAEERAGRYARLKRLQELCQ